MFASRAIGTTPGGHRYTSAAKFKSTRQLHHEEQGDIRRISELEDNTSHPKRSVACAFVSFLFCPILGQMKDNSLRLLTFVLCLGCIALFYSLRSLRAHNQGFYAEAVIFSKQSVRWSLISFVLGLILGSIIVFCLFVKAVITI